jgi:tRNA-dihydrouridine synthase
MIGRGAGGRPWLVRAIDDALAGVGSGAREPDRAERLGVVLDHLSESLAFYGERLGLKVFRKHLGWYVERAPWPADAGARRAAKAELCRLESASAVADGLKALWANDCERLAA